MDEHQIELTVERKIDKLDALLIKGRISQDEYDREMRRLSELADNMYKQYWIVEKPL